MRPFFKAVVNKTGFLTSFGQALQTLTEVEASIPCPRSLVQTGGYERMHCVVMPLRILTCTALHVFLL